MKKFSLKINGRFIDLPLTKSIQYSVYPEYDGEMEVQLLDLSGGSSQWKVILSQLRKINSKYCDVSFDDELGHIVSIKNVEEFTYSG